MTNTEVRSALTYLASYLMELRESDFGSSRLDEATTALQAGALDFSMACHRASYIISQLNTTTSN